MDTLIQVGVGIGLVAVIFGGSWWLAGWQTDRQFGRMDRAEKAAARIRDEIFATRKAYREGEKRMPIALDKLLEESWETYRSLSERSFWVRKEAAVTAISKQADEVVAAIKEAVAYVPTVKELDAEAVALNEQLNEAEHEHAEAVAKADRDMHAAVAQADRTLASECERIAKALGQVNTEKASRQ